jgi:hypothetical protein
VEGSLKELSKYRMERAKEMRASRKQHNSWKMQNIFWLK